MWYNPPMAHHMAIPTSTSMFCSVLDFDLNRRRTSNTRTQAITARELSINAVGGSGIERLKD